MACPTGNPVVDVAVGFFEFLGDPVGTIVKGVANAVLAGAIAVFGALTTAVPTLAGTDTARDVNGQSQWVVVYLAVGSLVFAAARMAAERRGTAGVTALKGILRVVLVSGAATTIVTAAASLSDRYADYLFSAGAQNQLNNVGSCSDGDGIQAFLLLVLAFLLLIAGIVHTILLYIRLGVMILLLGTLPLAAAASMTEWGSGWWRKHIGWMIAWLLYKPAAALVLYAGSAMITSGGSANQGGNDINERIAGIGVMLLSAVSLPALLKLVVPATAALGSGGVGGGVSQVGGLVASGARSIGSGSSGRGDAGPSGATGGSGRNGTTGGGGSVGAPGLGGQTGPRGSGGGTGAGGVPSRSGPGGAVGAAITTATTAARVVGNTAAGAVDGADGDRGHNH
ncbi:hypothetical protein [Streptomyces hyaluromycini]|uniref:hypothetical protein n=1 Tax=Streptomyces hyaluromycini TaxID=1377993 RepID=UPI000B5CF339|nr:hypothetical protein [Streptomyces hyaluromycini]